MAQLRCTNVAFCCSGCTPFSVDGANGRLLEVTDDLSCSIFSANTIAGLPVIEAFANYCVSMGQFGGHKLEVTCTSIRGGKCTTASGTYSFVGGGCCNVASCNYSIVGGGFNNTASGQYAFIGGGGGTCFGGPAGNYVPGEFSAVVGGKCNQVIHACSFIGGGAGNYSCCLTSTVSGGYFNYVCASRATIGGGIYNSASGYASTIGGGSSNKVTTNSSTISGGYVNCICVNTSCSTIGGGRSNLINYACGGFIGGGAYNCICNAAAGANFSSIVGGAFNCITGTCNIHIVGGLINGSSNNYTYVNNLCQTGGGLSDCRVKNTIQPLEFGLDHISQLQPVSFCWNGDPTCHKKYGFIAQNVQQAMSCVVTCNKLHRLGPNGIQVLNTEEGEPLLEFEKDAIYASYANAFKELKKENDELRTRLDLIESILKSNNLM